MCNSAITWVFQNSTAKNSERLMLLAIADSVNDDTGTAWPSVETLAAKVNVKERQAQNLIQALEGLGELHVKRAIGRRNTSTYQIIDADGKNIVSGEKVQPATEKVQYVTPFNEAEKVQSSTEKVQCSAEKVQPIAPDPIIPIEPKGKAPVSPPVEQTNGYFGMPKPLRRERVIADGYTQDAAKLGVSAAAYVKLFNTLIDIAGWRALVDANDDTKLNYAKRDALTLIVLGYCEPDQLRELADAYMKANTWRNKPPQPKDLAEYASQKQSGVLVEPTKERPGANREIHSVKFAKPGDDIYA